MSCRGLWQNMELTIGSSASHDTILWNWIVPKQINGRNLLRNLSKFSRCSRVMLHQAACLMISKTRRHYSWVLHKADESAWWNVNVEKKLVPLATWSKRDNLDYGVFVKCFGDRGEQLRHHSLPMLTADWCLSVNRVKSEASYPYSTFREE